MKLDDVLEMLESDVTDDRKARRKAMYFDLFEVAETVYRQNRKDKHDYDDDRRKRRPAAKYDRSKRE